MRKMFIFMGAALVASVISVGGGGVASAEDPSAEGSRPEGSPESTQCVRWAGEDWRWVDHDQTNGDYINNNGVGFYGFCHEPVPEPETKPEPVEAKPEPDGPAYSCYDSSKAFDDYGQPLGYGLHHRKPQCDGS